MYLFSRYCRQIIGRLGLWRRGSMCYFANSPTVYLPLRRRLEEKLLLDVTWGCEKKKKEKKRVKRQTKS
jgi:hypothetical protein